MVLNIDFSPRIKEKYILKNIKLNSLEEIDTYDIYPRSNGFEIWKLLNIFQEELLITGFLSEKYRSFYLDLLPGFCDFKFIEIKDILSRELEIYDGKDFLNIFTPEIRIGEEEIIDFYNLYYGLLNTSKLVFCSENNRTDLPSSVYRNIIHIGNVTSREIFFELKTLKTLDVLSGKSYSCIVTKEDLENIFKVYLNSIEELVGAGEYILRNGAREIYINDFENGILYIDGLKGASYLVSSDINLAKRSNMGLVAGILIGEERAYDLESRLKLAYGFNVAYNSFDEVEKISSNDVKRIMGSCKVREV